MLADSVRNLKINIESLRKPQSQSDIKYNKKNQLVMAIHPNSLKLNIRLYLQVEAISRDDTLDSICPYVISLRSRFY